MTVGCAGFTFLLGLAIAGTDLVLDYAGRSVDGRFIRDVKAKRGDPVSEYAYEVDGVRHIVHGGVASGTSSRIDYLPGMPGTARLHQDAGNDEQSGGTLALGGVILLAIGLLDRRRQIGDQTSPMDAT